MPALILIVGTQERNLALLDSFLAGLGYRCKQALGMAAMDQLLAADVNFDLALLDITGFDASIWQRCQMLHDRSVPFIIISPRQRLGLQQQGLEHGARSLLVKPVAMRELAGLVRGLLSEE